VACEAALTGPLGRVNSLGSFRFGPVARVGIILAAVAVGAFNASPHLHEAAWQDEAATISTHIGGGVFDPFLQYASPNNHAGFSALLVAWSRLFPGGLEVAHLRALPFVLFLLAIPLAYEAARRLAGDVVATLSTILFASSAVAGNFATQLRGYGPSWAFLCLALIAAQGSQRLEHRRSWLLAYVGATLCAVAMLPTNVYFCAAIGLAIAAMPYLKGRSLAKADIGRAAMLVLAPPVALVVAYGFVWRQLLAASALGFSDWSRDAVAMEWVHATVGDIVWIVPLFGGGTALLLIAGLRRRLPDLQAAALLAAVLIAGGTLAAVFVTPNTPFPRTLVPALPVWYCALSAIVMLGLSRLLEVRREWGIFILGAAVSLVPFVFTGTPSACRGDAGTGAAFEYDLCHQYFRDEYHPEQVLSVWAQVRNPNVPIVTGFEGYHALRVLASPARVFQYQHFTSASGQPPMLVAHDWPEARRMIGALQLGDRGYRLAADTGYFKVYWPSR
jgi:hypothetical protein